MATEGVKFHYRVPQSPHTPGFVEIFNRLVKRVIKAKISRAQISTFEFNNLLTYTEGRINNHPLAVTSELHDEHIITPSRLCINRDLRILPRYTVDRKLNVEQLRTIQDVAKRMRYLDTPRTHLWSKCLQGYVSCLQVYRKDLKQTRMLKKDDIVCIKDPTLMVTGRYPLARIDRVILSRSGFQMIRSAILVIPASGDAKERRLTRASEMLAILEIGDEDSPFMA